MDINKKVLVVEDDRDILDMIKYILTDEGYEVFGYDRVDLHEKILELQPTIILLDNRLSNGYGNTLCLKIKSDPDSKQIPVILVSAARDLEKIANDCLADGILPKPFDIDELLAVVKRYSNTQSLT